MYSKPSSKQPCRLLMVTSLLVKHFQSSVIFCNHVSLTANFLCVLSLKMAFVLVCVWLLTWVMFETSVRSWCLLVFTAWVGITAWPQGRIQRPSWRSSRIPHPQRTTWQTATARRPTTLHPANQRNPWTSSQLKTLQRRPGYQPLQQRLWTQL